MENTHHICKGCANEFTGSYCNLCGQKAIGRFSLRYLLNLLNDDLFEVNRGLLLTFKELTLRPGKMIRSYLDGDTKKYFSPVKYLFTAAALIYIVASISEWSFGDPASSPFSMDVWKAQLFSKDLKPFSIALFGEVGGGFPFIVRDYLGVYFLIILPFAALVGMWLFRNLNFTEVLITWIYLWSHVVFCLVFYSAAATLLISDDSSMTLFFIALSVFAVAMFYYFINTFREVADERWFFASIKVLGSMYGGFFAAFSLTWVFLSLVKLLI